MACADRPFLVFSVAPLAVLFLVAPLAHTASAASARQETPAETPAETPDSLKWQGALQVGAITLTLNFDIQRDGQGNYGGAIYSVEQGNAKIPITGMEIDGDRVRVEASSVKASYAGTLSADGEQVSGTWTQPGIAGELNLKRVDRFDSARHVETWQGTMQAGGNTFDFGLRVFRDEDGSWSAKLDSYSENVEGLPAQLDRDGSKFNFSIPVTRAEYEGTLDESAGKISGLWKQAGGEFELDFHKVALDAKPNLQRPQTPGDDVPYKQEPVRFDNPADQVSLAGTLTLPEGAGPWPAMVLISGSGPQDRDETLFSHKPFLVIADHLTRHGIAVLRYDDRGTAQSSGDFSTATSEDFSRDAEAGMKYLQSRPDIRSDRIGFIGHSEGGMIAPMIAARNPQVALIVLLAGPGVDGGQITLSQNRALNEVAGVPADINQASEHLVKRLLEKVRESDDPLADEFVDDVMAEASQLISKVMENEDPAAALLNTRAGLARMNSPWYRYFIRFDPQTALRQVQCPVLALNGTKDLQVLVDLNIDAIQQALTEAGNTDFEVHKLENQNHLFQETAGTGSVLDYGRIEQTISPVTLDLMTGWIKKRVDR